VRAAHLSGRARFPLAYKPEASSGERILCPPRCRLVDVPFLLVPLVIDFSVFLKDTIATLVFYGLYARRRKLDQWLQRLKKFTALFCYVLCLPSPTSRIDFFAPPLIS